jgi:hypothetical protein
VEDNGGLKDPADEKATTVWQQTNNYGWWRRSEDGTDDGDNKTTIK